MKMRMIKCQYGHEKNFRLLSLEALNNRTVWLSFSERMGVHWSVPQGQPALPAGVLVAEVSLPRCPGQQHPGLPRLKAGKSWSRFLSWLL